MSLSNEERVYIQNMQNQLNNMQQAVDELRRWKQEMEMRLAYQAGGGGGGPIGINPLGGRTYGSSPDQEGAHDSMTNEGGPAPKGE